MCSIVLQLTVDIRNRAVYSMASTVAIPSEQV